MLCALTHPLTHSRSKIKMKHKGITEKQLRWKVNGNKRGGEDFSGAGLEDFNTSSINWPSISNVCDQSVALLLKVCSHRRGFVRMCACHYRALQVETVCFDIPCCRQTESCFPLFPLRQYFPLWHVVFICWTKESLKLWAICLSRTARVMFLMPGSGNVFQCVIKSFDNYPLSISTEDMFIVLNDLLPVSLLFCILEIFSICLCFWHAL